MFNFVRGPLAQPARKPHVEVVVPCHNYGHFLADAVESIKAQPGVTTQVHIIDDASTDGSVAVAYRLAEQQQGIRVTHHQANKGHIATYNEGLSQADSDYVVLLSADDMLAPGALKRATRIMDARPDVGLVYGHPQTFEQAPIIKAPDDGRTQIWTGKKWIDAQFKRNMSIIYSPEAVVRTAVQHEVGYYRTDLPHSGDLEMWLRIAATADVGRVAGPDQAFRRVHAESMMNKGALSGVAVDLRERFKAYDAFLATFEGPSHERRSLQELLSRKMTLEGLHWATETRKASGDEIPPEIQQVLNFVESINPRFRDTNAWKEYAKVAGQRQGISAVGALLGRTQREIGGRVRWHRWERFGY
jgi:glycosyltransferase involved in cell wall biosynthesis